MDDTKTSLAGAAGQHETWGGRSLRAAAAAAAIAAAFLILWYGIQILLLVFAGILFGVLLSGLAEVVQDRTRLSYKPAFGVVLVTIGVLLVLLFWLFATRIAGETEQLSQELPQAASDLIEPLKRYEWIRRLMEETPKPQEVIRQQPEMVSRATGFLSSALSAATGMFLVLFVGVYTGFDPGLYRRGIVSLVPLGRRERAKEVLDRLGHTLRWWLVAHFSAMAVVGVLTWLGLALLDIPLAFILAVIAALLAFIPNIGPVLSAVPAVVLALSQGPRQAAYVVLLYIVVQAVESNLITPVFELKAVSLPPALTISVQLLLGSLAGALGLLVASPVCAAAMVLVQMLYIEDRLGEPAGEG